MSNLPFFNGVGKVVYSVVLFFHIYLSLSLCKSGIAFVSLCSLLYVTAVTLFRNEHGANIRDFKEDTKSFLYFCAAKKIDLPSR